MGTNITLAVLIGLPAAGKSTFCKSLFSSAEKNPEFKDYYFVHVCYDHLIPLSAQQEYAEAKKSGKEDEMDCWKTARHEIYVNVDKLLFCMKNNYSDDSIFKLFNVQIQPTGSLVYYVILLDDNFYYRSMRYEYFQLARKHTVGFCQVYIQCSPEIAIERNIKREKQVPTDVVLNMADKLQPPKPSENSWEAATYEWTLSSLGDPTGLWNIIRNCMLSPVQPVKDHEAEKEEARLICSRSVAHQADLFLRTLVGKVIKDALINGNMKGSDLSSFSEQVNASRQLVMDAVRKGSLLFPANLANAVDDSNRDNFESFIQSEFQKNL